MTTYEYSRSLLSDARERARPRMRAGLAALRRGWRRFQPMSLSVAGLGCLTAAAFTVSTMAGLIAAGLGCFVAEWRVRG